MSFRVRPARPEDFKAIYEMAKLTGGGFTNLPPDRDTLVRKLDRSAKSFARQEDSQAGDLYMFVLEDPKKRQIRGTCQVFGQVGVVQPFYSYHISTLTQASPELGKTFRNQTLTLTTDLEGSSEVGGLFLHPQVRAGGWGSLLAEARPVMTDEMIAASASAPWPSSAESSTKPATRLFGTGSPDASSA